MNIDALLSSQRFKQALFDVQTAECERYAASTVPVTFSPAFERKMDRLIRAQRQPYYLLVNTKPKRALLAFAIALLLLITMVFSVSALREPVVRFIVEVYERFSKVFYHQQEEEYFPATLETYFTPTWLPDGYQEDAGLVVDAIIFCERTFSCESGEKAKFMQYTITSSLLIIDTEDVQAEPCSVNGMDALCYSNKEIQNLIWNDRQYGFRITGPVSKADLLRMAESIEPLE